EQLVQLLIEEKEAATWPSDCRQEPIPHRIGETSTHGTCSCWVDVQPVPIQPCVHSAVALEHLDLYASLPQPLSQAQATNPCTDNCHLQDLLRHHRSNRNAA